MFVPLLPGHSRVSLILMVLLDVMIAIGSAKLSGYFRFGGYVPHYLHVIFIQALLVVVFSFLCDVYTQSYSRILTEYMSKIFVAWTLSFMVLIAFMMMTKTTAHYSRIWLFTWIGLAIPMALLSRLFLYRLIRSLFNQTKHVSHVLVICEKPYVQVIEQYFSQDNMADYRLQHLIEYQNEQQLLEELKEYLKCNEFFDECWLSIHFTNKGMLQALLFALRYSTANIRYIVAFRDTLLMVNRSIKKLGNFYSLDISCIPIDTNNEMIKRVFDFVMTVLMMIFIIPIMLGVAIAVKLSSPGPVLFKQYRQGVAGKRIKIYKFRSMVVHNEIAGQLTQAIKGDDRVTKVGAFLRRTSLDELPQFINVLQGRMSIVGPRPHALEHNEYYKNLVESYMQRHRVKPGITGLAQIRGLRGETDTVDKMQRRVTCDLEYINNWSLWLDIKIIIVTAIKFLVHPNGY